MLDALHRAERILGIEVFLVEAAPPDKEFRRRLSIEREDPCVADLWGRPLHYQLGWDRLLPEFLAPETRAVIPWRTAGHNDNSGVRDVVASAVKF